MELAIASIAAPIGAFNIRMQIAIKRYLGNAVIIKTISTILTQIIK
jgi:hypothetical protein